MKKKLLSVLLCTAMVAAMLVGCGGSEKPAENPTDSSVEDAEEPSAGAKTFKVGVAIYSYDDNFMTLYRNEIQDYFATLNTDEVTYDVTMVDCKNDMSNQSNQIDTFITQGMDAIILNLVQTSSADAIIDKVTDAGIPLVLINREPLAYDEDGNPLDEKYERIVNNPYVCYVGCDARQSGTYQGEIIANLDDNGDINGDGVVTYIMLVGDPENPDAQYRTEYSIKALTDAGIESKCLVEQIGMWDTAKGQEITSSALAQYGDEIEVVFSNNDGMALGAAAAIEAAGRKVGEDIYLVGVDALEECQEMIANGEMTGTVLNDHIGQSHTAVDVAIKCLNGEAIDNYYWVDYVKVN